MGSHSAPEPRPKSKAPDRIRTAATLAAGAAGSTAAGAVIHGIVSGMLNG